MGMAWGALGGEEGEALAEAADGGHAHVDGALHLLLGEEVGLALDHHDGRLRARDEEVQPRLAARTANPPPSKSVSQSVSHDALPARPFMQLLSQGTRERPRQYALGDHLWVRCGGRSPAAVGAALYPAVGDRSLTAQPRQLGTRRKSWSFQSVESR
jgi:hypothetical protein